MSLSPLLIRLAEHPSDTIAVIAGGTRTSYGVLTRDADTAALALETTGVRAGDTVAFLVEPGAE